MGECVVVGISVVLVAVEWEMSILLLELRNIVFYKFTLLHNLMKVYSVCRFPRNCVAKIPSLCIQ